MGNSADIDSPNFGLGQVVKLILSNIYQPFSYYYSNLMTVVVCGIITNIRASKMLVSIGITLVSIYIIIISRVCITRSSREILRKALLRRQGAIARIAIYIFQGVIRIRGTIRSLRLAYLRVSTIEPTIQGILSSYLWYQIINRHTRRYTRTKFIKLVS